MSETPDHYDMKIQPIEFIMANGLGFCEGNILKYISRYKQKGGIDDLLKAHYYLELLIDNYDGEDQDGYILPTPDEAMDQLEKKKAEKIAANKEWDAIVKACDKGEGVIVQEVEPGVFKRREVGERWACQGNRDLDFRGDKSHAQDQEIEQLENLKGFKFNKHKGKIERKGVQPDDGRSCYGD